MYNSNTIIIHLSCWDQHFLTVVVVLFHCRLTRTAEFPVQMTELHQVVDRQHDSSSDFLPYFKFSCQTLIVLLNCLSEVSI